MSGLSQNETFIKLSKAITIIKMSFLKLNDNEKNQLFKFISHLAIIAGQEMSEEGYQNYNNVVVEFLEDTKLIDDFQALAAKVQIAGFKGRC